MQCRTWLWLLEIPGGHTPARRAPRPFILCGWGAGGENLGSGSLPPAPCRSRNPFSGISIRMGPPPARGSASGEAGGIDGGGLGLSTPRHLESFRRGQA